MADIRINALATTAASTASDDFVAVDGSANGTRKLNAFSPTFGGNLTVSGTGTQAFSGAIQTTGGIGTTTASSAILDYSSGARVIARGASAGAYGVVKIAGTDSAGSAAITGGLVATFDSSNGATTLAGNLTVSGTGTSSVAGSFGVGGASPVVGFSGNEAAWVVGANRTDGGSGLYPILLTLNDTRAYDSTNPSPGGGLGFTYKYNAAGNYAAGVTIQGFKENTTDGNYAGAMRFLTRANGANPAEAARITSGGNFLLGTTTDGGQKLQVSGTAIVSSTTASTTTSTGALVVSGGVGVGKSLNVADGIGVGRYSAISGGSAKVDISGGGTAGLPQLMISDTTGRQWEFRGADASSSFILDFWNGSARTSNLLTISSGGNLGVLGNITTGAPSGGTAGAWKLGVRVAATTTLDTTQYLQVDIGGTLYKVALVTS